jgi:hypothetical protein
MTKKVSTRDRDITSSSSSSSSSISSDGSNDQKSTFFKSPSIIEHVFLIPTLLLIVNSSN